PPLSRLDALAVLLQGTPESADLPRSWHHLPGTGRGVNLPVWPPRKKGRKPLSFGRCCAETGILIAMVISLCCKPPHAGVTTVGLNV
ncbi:hypothetical protein, partial [Escherichia coli]|uniref:hypothetical protein n=1 Tax=Escherichia coli TaxID=562 RepID=UPI001BC8663E